MLYDIYMISISVGTSSRSNRRGNATSTLVLLLCSGQDLIDLCASSCMDTCALLNSIISAYISRVVLIIFQHAILLASIKLFQEHFFSFGTQVILIKYQLIKQTCTNSLNNKHIKKFICLTQS